LFKVTGKRGVAKGGDQARKRGKKSHAEPRVHRPRHRSQGKYIGLSFRKEEQALEVGIMDVVEDPPSKKAESRN